jgi:glycosyltransferase involved in cell wall biosynthesis
VIKITHLISTLEIGGAEIQLAQLLASATREQFRHSVISLIDAGPVAEMIRSQGIPVYSLGMERSVPSLSSIWKLHQLLSIERPQILQTWLYHADLLGLIVGKLARVPSLVWNVRCSDVDMEHYPKLSKLVRTALSRLSVLPDVVIVNSAAGRAAHARIGYRPRRFEVIPNGIEVDRFRPDCSAAAWLRGELRLSGEAVLIGLVARYDPMKDHEMFLVAARQVCGKHPRAHFILSGKFVDKSNTRLTKLIESYGLTQRIRLLGGRSDIERITAAFDIACSSSAFGEGFSNAVGEAMACGVPCVVTDCGDSALIVGSTGRVVPPRNAKAFANALCELIEAGPEIRRELGEKGRARIAERYDVNRMAARYDQVYLSLSGENVLRSNDCRN